jgi:hypothetical protein
MREVYTKRIGDWSVVMEWPDDAEAGGPTRLEIKPVDPNSPPIGGLSSTVLRAVNFQEAADKLAGFFAMAREQNRQSDDVRGKELRKALDAGVSDEYLVELCAFYIRLVERGREHPSEYLSELIGKSASTIKGHLWQAKKRDLFVGSSSRVGGNFTPEGERIFEKLVMRRLERPDS